MASNVLLGELYRYLHSSDLVILQMYYQDSYTKVYIKCCQTSNVLLGELYRYTSSVVRLQMYYQESYTGIHQVLLYFKCTTRRVIQVYIKCCQTSNVLLGELYRYTSSVVILQMYCQDSYTGIHQVLLYFKCTARRVIQVYIKCCYTPNVLLGQLYRYTSSVVRLQMYYQESYTGIHQVLLYFKCTARRVIQVYIKCCQTSNVLLGELYRYTSSVVRLQMYCQESYTGLHQVLLDFKRTTRRVIQVYIKCCQTSNVLLGELYRYTSSVVILQMYCQESYTGIHQVLLDFKRTTRRVIQVYIKCCQTSNVLLGELYRFTSSVVILQMYYQESYTGIHQVLLDFKRTTRRVIQVYIKCCQTSNVLLGELYRYTSSVVILQMYCQESYTGIHQVLLDFKRTTRRVIQVYIKCCQTYYEDSYTGIHQVLLYFKCTTRRVIQVYIKCCQTSNVLLGELYRYTSSVVRLQMYCQESYTGIHQVLFILQMYQLGELYRYTSSVVQTSNVLLGELYRYTSSVVRLQMYCQESYTGIHQVLLDFKCTARRVIQVYIKCCQTSNVLLGELYRQTSSVVRLQMYCQESYTGIHQVLLDFKCRELYRHTSSVVRLQMYYQESYTGIHQVLSDFKCTARRVIQVYIKCCQTSNVLLGELYRFTSSVVRLQMYYQESYTGLHQVLLDFKCTARRVIQVYIKCCQTSNVLLGELYRHTSSVVRLQMYYQESYTGIHQVLSDFKCTARRVIQVYIKCCQTSNVLLGELYRFTSSVVRLQMYYQESYTGIHQVLSDFKCTARRVIQVYIKCCQTSNVLLGELYRYTSSVVRLQMYCQESYTGIHQVLLDFKCTTRRVIQVYIKCCQTSNVLLGELYRYTSSVVRLQMYCQESYTGIHQVLLDFKRTTRRVIQVYIKCCYTSNVLLGQLYRYTSSVVILQMYCQESYTGTHQVLLDFKCTTRRVIQVYIKCCQTSNVLLGELYRYTSSVVRLQMYNQESYTGIHQVLLDFKCTARRVIQAHIKCCQTSNVLLGELYRYTSSVVRLQMYNQESYTGIHQVLLDFKRTARTVIQVYIKCCQTSNVLLGQLYRFTSSVVRLQTYYQESYTGIHQVLLYFKRTARRVIQVYIKCCQTSNVLLGELYRYTSSVVILQTYCQESYTGIHQLLLDFKCTTRTVIQVYIECCYTSNVLLGQLYRFTSSVVRLQMYYQESYTGIHQVLLDFKCTARRVIQVYIKCCYTSNVLLGQLYRYTSSVVRLQMYCQDSYTGLHQVLLDFKRTTRRVIQVYIKCCSTSNVLLGQLYRFTSSVVRLQTYCQDSYTGIHQVLLDFKCTARRVIQVYIKCCQTSNVLLGELYRYTSSVVILQMYCQDSYTGLHQVLLDFKRTARTVIHAYIKCCQTSNVLLGQLYRHTSTLAPKLSSDIIANTVGCLIQAS